MFDQFHDETERQAYRPYVDLLSTKDRRRIRWEVIKGIVGAVMILAIIITASILLWTLPKLMGW